MPHLSAHTDASMLRPTSM